MSKTKLSFNILPKRVSWSHKKSLGFSSERTFIYRLLPTQYTIQFSPHFNSVRTHILVSPYAYTFVHMHAILTFHVFGLCSYVRMPFSPDRGLPLSPNSVLHIWTQISTELPLPFIAGLICGCTNNCKSVYGGCPILHHQHIHYHLGGCLLLPPIILIHLFQPLCTIYQLLHP